MQVCQGNTQSSVNWHSLVHKEVPPSIPKIGAEQTSGEVVSFNRLKQDGPPGVQASKSSGFRQTGLLGKLVSQTSPSTAQGSVPPSSGIPMSQ